MKNAANIFILTCQNAAVMSWPKIGKKDKHAIDELAVKAMQDTLSTLEEKAEVVIGEGELEDAPMLYKGEVFGKNSPVKYDLAIDPIEGTTNCAYSCGPSAACLVYAKKGAFVDFIEMYMEKWFAKKEYLNNFDINWSLETKITHFKENFKGSKPRVIILDKPRHQDAIKLFKEEGFEVSLIKDGDILAAINCVIGKHDLLYGIGGAPEGSIIAGLANASGYSFFGKLVQYHSIWPNELETNTRTNIEINHMQKLKKQIQHTYTELDCVNDKECGFVASFITGDHIIKGVVYKNNVYNVNTIHAHNGQIFYINSFHTVKQNTITKIEEKIFNWNIY